MYLAMKTIVVQIGTSLPMEVKEDKIRDLNSATHTPYRQAAATTIQQVPPI